MKTTKTLVILVLVLCLIAEVANADLYFGTPENIGSNINGPHDEYATVISPDGCTMYFSSARPGRYGGYDIYEATRESIDDEWGLAVHLIWPVNTEYNEYVWSISADGLSLYMSSNRPNGYGNNDLWVTTRETTSSPWGTPVNLGPVVNRPSGDYAPFISPDGLTLYFGSNRSGGYGGLDLWVTTRETTSSPWDTPVNLGPIVNSSSNDYAPSISSDGFLLFFTSTRKGGYGGEDIYVTTRPSIFDQWGIPVNLGSQINTPATDCYAHISVDGSILYFTSEGHLGYGIFDFFTTPVYDVPTCGDTYHPYPIGDLNMDCIVDENDLILLSEHLGECTAPECDDIPYPPDVTWPPESNAFGSVDIGTVYQELEGFGASVIWYAGWLIDHPLKNEIYNCLFGQLGLDIYRLRNTYETTSTYIDNSETILEAAEQSLGHPLKVMISSYSPPTYLKSNSNTIGGTLKKDSNGYLYEEFAQWWADSLEEYAAHGIIADYINIQNQPAYERDYDSCVFAPTEIAEFPGYNLAFEAVYQEFNSRPIVMPKMLAPEAYDLGFTQAYIDTLIYPEHVYGYAHQLSINSPESKIPGMEYFAAYNDKPLFQTESDTGSSFSDAMNLAHSIHNSLTVEGVSAYFYGRLLWEDSSGLVSLDNPWQSNPGYTISPLYYALKQYSSFTDPGWRRVEASTDSTDLRISAFISPDENELTIVVINVSNIDIDLSLSLGDFVPDSSEVFRTSESENTTSIGLFDQSQPMTFPLQTITTIKLTGSYLP